MTASTDQKCRMDCGKPTGPDAYVCPDCVDQARKDLAVVADLLPLSPAKRARVGAIDYRTLGTPGPAEAPLPFDPRVSRVTDPICVGLLGTYHVVIEGRGAHLALPGRVGAVAVARWLGEHLDWLATRAEGAEELAFIEKARSNLERLFDRPPDALYLGECGRDLEDMVCREHVYVENKRPLATFATCRRCQGAVDVNERREIFAEQVKLYQATMRELVSLAPLFLAGDGVSQRTLKEWTRHGLLRPVGERVERNVRGEWRKVPTYRMGDLAEARNEWEAGKERRAEKDGRRRMSA